MNIKFSHFSIAALLICSLNAVAQPPEPRKDPPPVIEPAPEPQEVIETFVNGVFNNFDDVQNAANQVVGGQNLETLKPIAVELKTMLANWTAWVRDIEVKIDGDNAEARFRLRLQDGFFVKITHDERLNLKRDINGWKIVPLPTGTIQRAMRGSFDSDILQGIASLLAHPEEMEEIHSQSCLNNLKQLALGAMQFVQDWDEKFALKADKYQDALMPYIRSEKIFHCPDDKSGALSYSFNAKFQNISLAQIAEPAQTVMIYEGKNGQLEFRHNNRAGIAFADGHCQLVTPEEAKTLRWKP